MKRTRWFALLAAPPLLCAAAAQAQDGSPPGQATAPPAGTMAPNPAPSEVQLLRMELERLRREAEEQRKQQEERIRNLEQKLEDLNKNVSCGPPGAAPGKSPGASQGTPTSAPPSPGANTPPPPNPVTTRPGFKARLYGFARADVDVDSRQFFAHPHLPFWVLSGDDPRRENGDGDFTIHPRLSRLGLDTEAPPIRQLGDTKLTGKIEVDFFNFAPGNAAATSNSRQFLRIRHAYGQLEHGDGRLLFGQTWDLISPLYPAVNYDVLMWNAGNIGDRRPQLRATWEPRVGKGKASVAVAALDSSAIDGANRDGDFTLDGEEARRPMVQARAGINQPSWVKGQTWEVGVSGHNAEYRWNRAAAIEGRRVFSGNSVGLDVRLPVTSKLVLQGEGWIGRGLADVRGGIGQSINPLTGDAVHSKGGWAEALYQFNKVYTLGAGVTVDNPDDDDLPAFGEGTSKTTNFDLVGRTHNRAYYIANRFNLGSGFLVGLDWMLFDTSYKHAERAVSNRWNFWLQHNF